MPSDGFRRLPSVDRILRDPRLGGLPADRLRTQLVRQVLDDARRDVASGADVPTIDQVIESVALRTREELTPPLRSLINATGVILHTNLGRAPLAQDAINAMAAVSGSYCNLEFDQVSGRRGPRHTLLEPLLRRLTGAEAAMIVNNNASAVLLALAALGAGREI